MISDNLAPLFDTGQPGVRFRQGTVTAWNPSTGANTIDVAGGTLTDVPILNTGEAIALKAGHVVGLLGQGSTWFIVGRITPAGDANFAAASVAFGSAGAQLFNYATSTSMVTKVSSNELVVPDWADEAIVIVTGNASVSNTTGANSFAMMEVGCSGGAGGSSPTHVVPGATAGVAASSRNHFTGLSGGNTLQITGAIQTGAAFAATASNCMFIHAIAVYKSNV
ncbi:hypothetical protein [Kribbella sp. CA-293567]|uniref:hypothetical protein n=1 Tax=Kribbella sp. CA-293567 TaxID=3002436 RepID=UPI0022DE8946|nr:hypothetical protein [Kribbella sp. CA-293567]WBQ02937.1 hypothetical protein OX958_23490 [Kribbella sp. CA-293567]